jgi:NADPH:quinone reductase-like Zn-dependent oxidoreductase
MAGVLRRERLPSSLRSCKSSTGCFLRLLADGGATGRSGYTVVTTCSPRNFDLVKSLGADAVYDYVCIFSGRPFVGVGLSWMNANRPQRDPNCAAEIHKFTNGKLSFVLDCISSDVTAAVCAGAIGSAGGKYSCLIRPLPKMPRDDVTTQLTFAYTGVGEPFSKGTTEFPAVEEDYEFQKNFWNLAEVLLAEGKLKAHPPNVRGGGLKGIPEGLQLMREDKVSGQKLVYRVAETPK